MRSPVCLTDSQAPPVRDRPQRIALQRLTRGAALNRQLTALLLLLTAFAISVAINVPINTAQQGWPVAASPSDWSSVRDRWQLAHVARTSTTALAFVLLAAVTTSRKSLQGNATQAQPTRGKTP